MEGRKRLGLTAFIRNSLRGRRSTPKHLHPPLQYTVQSDKISFVTTVAAFPKEGNILQMNSDLKDHVREGLCIIKLKKDTDERSQR